MTVGCWPKLTISTQTPSKAPELIAAIVPLSIIRNLVLKLNAIKSCQRSVRKLGDLRIKNDSQ